jgi:hypothetical protein
MRSPIGPILVVFGLATTVVLVLLLFQNLGLRSDLEAARAEVAELRTAVGEMEPGVTDDDLVRRLDDLESGIRDWLIATGADGGFDTSPGADPAAGAAVVERLDEILERIEALDERVDQICENVPVC